MAQRHTILDVVHAIMSLRRWHQYGRLARSLSSRKSQVLHRRQAHNDVVSCQTIDLLHDVGEPRRGAVLRDQ
eukprot:4500998-Prorocentrum_lima.AAC.1